MRQKWHPQVKQCVVLDAQTLNICIERSFTYEMYFNYLDTSILQNVLLTLTCYNFNPLTTPPISGTPYNGLYFDANNTLISHIITEI